MTAVSYEVLCVEHCRRGAIIGVARTAVTIDGVEIVLDGWTVREKGQQIITSAPQFRHPVSGDWWPVVGLPGELVQAVADEIMERLGLPVT